jgi:tRNA nucleotidyltransferase (CCA-adding enzyme)
MRRLKLPTSLMADVLTLIEHHDRPLEATPKSVKRTLNRLGGRPEMLRALCDLKRADARAQAERCHYRVKLIDDVEQILDDILAAREPFSLKDLELNGQDILALGVKEGPMIGQILEATLGGVIDKKVTNKKKPLLKFVRTYLRDHQNGSPRRA